MHRWMGKEVFMTWLYIMLKMNKCSEPRSPPSRLWTSLDVLFASGVEVSDA